MRNGLNGNEVEKELYERYGFAKMEDEMELVW